MAWPSSKSTGALITPTLWNEIVDALTAAAGPYVQVSGASTVTPEITNGVIEVDLNRSSTTLAAPTYNGSTTLPSNIRFVLKLTHSVDSSDVVWNSAYKGVTGYSLSGVSGHYSMFSFISRPDGSVELISIPLIGAS